MRLFIALLDPENRGLSQSVRSIYESLPRSRGLECSWHPFTGALVLTARDDSDGEQLVARHDNHVAIGSVRLDNRSDIEHLTNETKLRLTDLELVLRAVASHGRKCISRFLGDFTFVVWNSATRHAIAATDAFAVRKLYYAARHGLMVFASRGEALGLQGGYELQYLAELAGGGVLSPGLSAYEGVQQLPGGTLGVLEGGHFTTDLYWDPARFHTDHTLTAAPQESAETCRDLLAEAVRFRLSQDGRTWAQLSGGLDSSSVVCLSQWLAEQGGLPHGLAGTVTYADLVGTEADEREYSEAVVGRWRLCNHTIVNSPLWVDRDHRPPYTDQPRDTMATHPRERRLAEIVKSAGGRVLLSGFGGDELLTGTMLFFADWVANGRVWPAIREMAHRAAVGRVSLWDLGYRNAVLPLLPGPAHRWLLRNEGGVKPWMRSDAIRRYNLRERVTVTAAYGGPAGHKYGYALMMSVSAISRHFDAGYLGELLDVRYPFLYRPLVEFALQLPPELCARPQARKWILREAMRGILPELVRTRIGKGDPLPAFARSLTVQRGLLEPLLREPILAELGIVDPIRLRSALDAAPQHPHRKDQLHNHLQSILTLEAWLQLRAGRWPPTSHVVGT
jgi:asparagine synthase (glutamine-hydrolysing)